MKTDPRSIRMPNFRPCKYSSEFCIEVLTLGNKDLKLLVEDELWRASQVSKTPQIEKKN